MFFIDHAAKTTSFIDPRLPNDLPNIPVQSAPPHLLLPNDPNATLLPPPPPKHHGASLTPPPINRISGSAFDMPVVNELDNSRNSHLPTNKSSKEPQHLMPPSLSDCNTGQGGNSRRRSRSVGEEEISRENIEAVSDATSVLTTAAKTSSTRSHNMTTPTSPPIRGESAGSSRSPPVVQGPSPKPPSTYNGRVVAFLRQHNIIDILKGKSSAITSNKFLRDKVNMIRQDGCHALERLSCDVELIILLR